MYKYHIEVTFNVAFSLLKNRKGAIEVTSSIKPYDLVDRYNNTFYLKLYKII